MSHDIVRDAREDREDATKWRRRNSTCLALILSLAERQHAQDRASLSGPSITLEQRDEFEADVRALSHFRSHFNLT